MRTTSNRSGVRGAFDFPLNFLSEYVFKVCGVGVFTSPDPLDHFLQYQLFKPLSLDIFWFTTHFFYQCYSPSWALSESQLGFKFHQTRFHTLYIIIYILLPFINRWEDPRPQRLFLIPIPWAPFPESLVSFGWELAILWD